LKSETKDSGNAHKVKSPPESSNLYSFARNDPEVQSIGVNSEHLAYQDSNLYAIAMMANSLDHKKNNSI
jgi:hypothetical protein